jgi:hypothetical protein
MSKKLQGTLYTLYHLANQIDLMFKTVLELNMKFKEWNPLISENDKTMSLDKVAIPALTNNIFIMTCSFLDEWNGEFNHIKLPEYSDRILRVKRITKPLFKRINKWKNLRDVRNMVLAHNLRRKDGSDIFTDGIKEPIIFPWANSEVTLLTTLIKIIFDEIYDEFKDIEIDPQKSVLDGLDYTPNHIDAHAETMELFDKVIEIKMQEFDKQYGHLNPLK